MKKGDLMRDEILAAAEKLFFTNGYEDTGVQDILDALKLSKGGFHHYFNSKESVMREICERRIAERLRRAEPELYVCRARPIDKLNRLLKLVGIFDWNDAQYAAIMLRLCYKNGGDAQLRESLRRSARDQLRPYLDETIAEGIALGKMCPRYPNRTGEIILRMADDLNDEACALLSKDPENLDSILEITDRVHAYRDAIEVLLGAPFGSIWLYDMPVLVGDLRRAMRVMGKNGGK